MGVSLFYVQKESFPSRIINSNKRFYEPGICYTMLLPLRRTLVQLNPNEQRTMNNIALLIALLPFRSNVQVSDTTGDATCAAAGNKKIQLVIQSILTRTELVDKPGHSSFIFAIFKSAFKAIAAYNVNE